MFKLYSTVVSTVKWYLENTYHLREQSGIGKVVNLPLSLFFAVQVPIAKGTNTGKFSALSNTYML